MNDMAHAGADETLRRIRTEKFDHIPVELLESVFQMETETQFEADRKPTVARLRDLVLGAEGEQ